MSSKFLSSSFLHRRLHMHHGLGGGQEPLNLDLIHRSTENRSGQIVDDEAKAGCESVPMQRFHAIQVRSPQQRFRWWSSTQSVGSALWNRYIKQR